jgi:hypothetical protein
MLKGIAAKRSALDAEELTWLRRAVALRIWRHLGMVDAADYMERELGYAPHTARERLRVASALEELPALEAALARGELCFSAVREVSRVATAGTEHEWLDAVRGKGLRMIEDLVSGKAPGDRPGDPDRPDVRMHKLTLELSPEVYARVREARTRMADDDGHRPDDDALMNALCDALDSDAEPGAARFQIAIQTCPSCERAWQDGGGRRVEIEPATLERAQCDAQHVGSLDGPRPERARQTIPPATVRFVWRRDGTSLRSASRITGSSVVAAGRRRTASATASSATRAANPSVTSAVRASLAYCSTWDARDTTGSAAGLSTRRSFAVPESLRSPRWCAWWHALHVSTSWSGSCVPPSARCTR